MCGIIGFNFQTENTRYLSIANHRGPDNTGVVKINNFTFAHNRLSIIDLSPEANQPFFSADKNFMIVFNGEVFNFKELKKKLQHKYEFRTNSDTEVILYSFIEKGKKCLDDFIGMFAFAILDIKNNRIFAARDRLGIKPLNYFHRQGKFIFASEIKVIKELAGQQLTVNLSSIYKYLHYLYVPFPDTVFNEIHKLPPAHYLEFQNDKLEITSYWDIENFAGRNSLMKEPEILENLDILINNSVKLRMISDVPLGLFLSGGIDSSAILYYLNKNSTSQVNTFTLGFPGAGLYDERKDASTMAEFFNSNHSEINIKPGIAELLPKMVFHFDEPFGNPTALLIHELTKETKKSVTVALAGDGGDEILGGYPRYRAAILYEKLKFLPKFLFKSLNPFFSLLPENNSGNHQLRRIKTFISSLTMPEGEMYESWVSYFTQNEINKLFSKKVYFERIVKEFYDQMRDCSPLLKASITDLKTFLPCNLLTYGDIMSMANSFEVRFPLIDHRIVEFMTSVDIGLRIRHGEKKYLLKRLLKNKIPESIINKPKLGLNPPMGIWLKKDLKILVNEYLGKDSITGRGLLDFSVIQNLISEHDRNKRDRSLHIWALIVLEEWFRQNNVSF